MINQNVVSINIGGCETPKMIQDIQSITGESPSEIVERAIRNLCFTGCETPAREFYSPNELAKVLCVTPRTIFNWIKAWEFGDKHNGPHTVGLGPVVRASRNKLLIPKESVNAWRERNMGA